MNTIPDPNYVCGRMLLCVLALSLAINCGLVYGVAALVGWL